MSEGIKEILQAIAAVGHAQAVTEAAMSLALTLFDK